MFEFWLVLGEEGVALHLFSAGDEKFTVAQMVSHLLEHIATAAAVNSLWGILAKV